MTRKRSRGARKALARLRRRPQPSEVYGERFGVSLLVLVGLLASLGALVVLL